MFTVLSKGLFRALPREGTGLGPGESPEGPGPVGRAIIPFSGENRVRAAKCQVFSSAAGEVRHRNPVRSPAASLSAWAGLEPGSALITFGVGRGHSTAPSSCGKRGRQSSRDQLREFLHPRCFILPRGFTPNRRKARMQRKDLQSPCSMAFGETNPSKQRLLRQTAPWDPGCQHRTAIRHNHGFGSWIREPESHHNILPSAAPAVLPPSLAFF